MIEINQPWPEIAELSFKLFCAYAKSLNANKFITLVPVNKMKYLLKCQYWNCQFINFIDTHDTHA